jgi:hypothetical protein
MIKDLGAVIAHGYITYLAIVLLIPQAGIGIGAKRHIVPGFG